MRYFFLSIVFLLISIIASSQNVLEIKNKETGKSRLLKQGAKLHVKTIHDSSFVKAKIVLIKDSVITFYVPDFEDESPLLDVSVKDIKEIQKASTFHSISKGVGSVTLPVGTYLLVNGGLGLLRGSNDDKSETTTFTLVGLGVSAISIIPFIIKPNNYKKSNGWEFNITTKK